MSPSDDDFARPSKQSRTDSGSEVGGAEGDEMMHNTRSRSQRDDPLLGYTFKSFPGEDGGIGSIRIAVSFHFLLVQTTTLTIYAR